MPPVPVLTDLRFQPGVPLWLLAAVGMLCLAALGLGLWRRARGTVWRGLAFAVLLFWLAGPMLVRETRNGLADIALLVVDQTNSMAIGNRTSLAEAARRSIGEQAARLPDLELRTITVPEAGHDGTRLFAAVDAALGNIPVARLAGVIAVTDGQVHDRPAHRLPAPLHVLIAARGEETDRRIRLIEAPPYGIVGRSVILRAVVEDLGGKLANSAPGGTARLTVRRDGAPPVSQDVPIGAVRSIEIPITRAGPSVVELATDTLPGEVSTANNRAVVSIEGVRDRLRVLLISGEPNQGERSWRRLLKSDPAVDLVHFTILRPPDKYDPTPIGELALIAFPVRELFEDKIGQFDLIILDRFADTGLLPPVYLRYIASYVQQGGGLLLTIGPESVGAGSLDQTGLGPVLPARASARGVIEQEFRPLVTGIGQLHPVTAGLPGANSPGGGAASWGPWFRAIATGSPDGQVLMTGPEDTPLLVLNRVGKGRAALLLSDQSWLWSRDHAGGGPEAELMRRVAHWLMQEPALEEEGLTARMEAGRLLVERRSLRPAPPGSVTVTPPSGPARTVALAPAGPGQQRAETVATAPGVWQVDDGGHTAFAAASTANPPEQADLRATASKLGELARESGGGVHWLDPDGAPALRRVSAGPRASGTGWIGLPRREAHLVTGVDAVPLMPAWAALPLLLGLLLMAWRREAG